MLNKKVLLATLLLVATPSFALMNSKVAKDTADKFNEKIMNAELPNLLEAVDVAIKRACENGEYNISVEVLKYNVIVIKRAEDILSREGYQISQLPGYPDYSSFLYIQWL